MRFIMRSIMACVLIMVLQGCETVKGASQGLNKDTENTYKNVKTGTKKAGEGIAVGAVGMVSAVKNADTWIRENLW